MCHARLLATAVVMVTTLMNAAGDKPQIYRNEEFGITLTMPEGVLLCPTPDDEHDHGPLTLLGTADAKHCQDAEHRRNIDIFASFNAIEETKTLDNFLKSQCTGVFKGGCLPAPPRLSVNGLRSAAARVNHANGWIDILVVTQAGKPDPLFDGSVPSINYDLSLHTRPEHLKEDLRVFRTVLETIRFSPAQ
jgi:hypothetical protein